MPKDDLSDTSQIAASLQGEILSSLSDSEKLDEKLISCTDCNNDLITENNLSLIKKFKNEIKSYLFKFCSCLNYFSLWIQKEILESTLEKKRAEDNLEVPLPLMDKDLLSMYIRWNGHHVEKTVRYKKEAGRGWGKPQLLRKALNEWHSRGYENRRWITWAEENLLDYAKWQETGEPQIHSEKTLPPFTPESPVTEVLKNRVSTRFWKAVPVEDDIIDKVIEAGAYAPTSCNRQTWKLYVKKNKDLSKSSSSAPNVSNKALLEKAPVLIYITIDNRLYPEVWAGAQDAGIIGLQLNLAAASLGLAGCLMYGADNFDQDKFRKQYNVPTYRYMHLLFLFGHAAERTLTDKRIQVDEIAIFVE